MIHKLIYVERFIRQALLYSNSCLERSRDVQEGDQDRSGHKG